MNAIRLQRIVDELSVQRAVEHGSWPRSVEGSPASNGHEYWAVGPKVHFVGDDARDLEDIYAPRAINGHGSNGHSAYASNGWAVPAPWQASTGVGSGPAVILGAAVSGAGISASLDGGEEMGWGATGVAAALASLWAFVKANKVGVALSLALWALVAWVYWPF